MILERLALRRRAPGFDIYAAPGVRKALMELDDRRRGPAIALLDSVAEHGPPTMKSQCNTLGDGIFELKPPGIRIPFFYDPGRRAVIILTHVTKKQKLKMPRREIKQARRVRDRIIDAQAQGTIGYE
jgi:phage-related protein